MSLTIVISHSPVKGGVGCAHHIEPVCGLICSPLSFKNVRSIAREESITLTSWLGGRCPLRHDGICALPPQHFERPHDGLCDPPGSICESVRGQCGPSLWSKETRSQYPSWRRNQQGIDERVIIASQWRRWRPYLPGRSRCSLPYRRNNLSNTCKCRRARRKPTVAMPTPISISVAVLR
jgi:hypothetical protein